MTRRTIGLNVAMWALGVAAFAAFAWLVQWLDGTAVDTSELAQVSEEVSADQPMAALTVGVARTAATARDELLTGSRSQAAHAVDAALRALEVGHAASHSEVGAAFAVALLEIHEAREALHLGRPDDATVRLHKIVDELSTVVEEARAMSLDVPPEEVRSAYHGAVLVNANGSMVGQVQRIEERDQGPVAIVRIGGANDVLGIMDFGGSQTEVPADRLLWGPRRSIGSVLVAIPTESSDPDTIVAELGAD